MNERTKKIHDAEDQLVGPLACSPEIYLATIKQYQTVPNLTWNGKTVKDCNEGWHWIYWNNGVVDMVLIYSHPESGNKVILYSGVVMTKTDKYLDCKVVEVPLPIWSVHNDGE